MERTPFDASIRSALVKGPPVVTKLFQQLLHACLAHQAAACAPCMPSRSRATSASHAAFMLPRSQLQGIQARAQPMELQPNRAQDWGAGRQPARSGAAGGAFRRRTVPTACPGLCAVPLRLQATGMQHVLAPACGKPPCRSQLPMPHLHQMRQQQSGTACCASALRVRWLTTPSGILQSLTSRPSPTPPTCAAGLSCVLPPTAGDGAAAQGSHLHRV